jgi:hypothetical protein
MINQKPIFIVGYPRSGTTLLQTLLSTQNNFISFPETHFFSTILTNMKITMEGTLENKYEISKLLKENIKQDNWKNTNIYNTLHNNEYLSIKNLFESIILHYTKDSDQRWIEKTPNHIYMIDTIKRYYPKAKFIYLLRDPLNAIYSRKLKLPYDKSRSIELLTQYWINSIIAYENFKLLYPDDIILIKYEDLANNYRTNIKNLEKFLDFKLDETLLENYSDQLEKVSHKWETWKDNNKSSIKNSQNYNLPEQFRIQIQLIASEYMKKYGYIY